MNCRKLNCTSLPHYDNHQEMRICSIKTNASIFALCYHLIAFSFCCTVWSKNVITSSVCAWAIPRPLSLVSPQSHPCSTIWSFHHSLFCSLWLYPCDYYYYYSYCLFLAIRWSPSASSCASQPKRFMHYPYRSLLQYLSSLPRIPLVTGTDRQFKI